jgi:hypothetical protein
MKIRYHTRAEINEEAWDNCITQSPNGRIYAFSWYLDHMAGQWDALIGGDYEAVFPLPWNAKWMGLKQVFHPYFSQQLGLFGAEASSHELLQRFLEIIPTHFRYVSLALNEANQFAPYGEWLVQEKTNFLLDLNQEVASLDQGYSKSLRKRIRRASQHLTIQKDHTDTTTFVDAYRTSLRHKFVLPDRAFLRVKHLLKDIQDREMGKLYTASTLDGTSVAQIFLPESNGRLYYIMGYATEQGKKLFASHFLLDAIFRSRWGEGLTFDFEGSSIPGVAEFFASFGATPTTYPVITRDRWPWWVKIAQQLKG